MATPGRLEDMFRRKAEGLDLVSCVRALDVLVLDEADRLLDMGFEARYWCWASLASGDTGRGKGSKITSELSLAVTSAHQILRVPGPSNSTHSLNSSSSFFLRRSFLRGFL